MKSSKKALAFALAAAMVVTAVPVTPTEAASTAKLSATKATVYTGSSKYIAVKTPSSWKSVKLAVSSSNKSVASVKKNNAEKKIKVTAVKAGTAKVTVKVTAKKSGKKVTKTLKANVTVKDYKVRLTAGGKTVSGTELTAAVGTPVELVAKTAPANETVTFKSSDETIATVDAAGKVTPVKAGEVTITASTAKASDTVKVVVKEIIFDNVKQTKINQIELSYKGDASKITKDDVVITRTSDNQRIYTKAVSDNTTDKKLVVDTLLDMTDSKEFTVVCKDNTLKFTATDGKLANLGLEKTEIVYNTATKINLLELDSNGVELKKIDCTNAVGRSDGIEYKIDVTSDKGYFTANGLVLNKVGDTASVTATKHSGVYKDGKEDGNIEFTGTITAIDAATITGDPIWTLSGMEPYDWSKITPQHFLILEEPTNLYMYVKDTQGNEIVKGDPTSNGYSVVSTNKDIVFVDGNLLTPNKEGTVVININDKNGKTIWSYQIEVKAKAKPVSFTASKSSVTLSNAKEVASAYATVDFVAKDQYGRDIAGTYFVTENTKPDGAAANCVCNGSVVNNNTKKATIQLQGSDGTIEYTKGNYSYKVELKVDGKTVYTNIIGATVQQPDKVHGRVSYQLLLDNQNAAKTVDTTVKEDSLGNQWVTVSVGKFFDGVLGQFETMDERIVTVKDKDGNNVPTNGSIGGRDLITTGDTSFTFYARTNSSNNMLKASTGTYTVTVKVPSATAGQLQEIKQYITVTDNQPKVTLSKRDKAETVKLTGSDAIGSYSDPIKASILGAFEFNYDNKALTSLDGTGKLITVADGTKGELTEASIQSYDVSNRSTLADGTERFFVKSFKVTVPVVFGDINGDHTIDSNDVVYVTESVNAGYYLQYK